MKINYIVIPLIAILVSALGGYFTSQGVNDWYEGLVKPGWTPSGEFIGAVWAFLYVLVTVVVLIYWNRHYKEKRFKLVMGVFVLNALLNTTWSFSFFTLNYVGFAFLHIITLNLTILTLILLLWPASRILSLSLVPYAIWVTIAGTLNYFIWILN